MTEHAAGVTYAIAPGLRHGLRSTPSHAAGVIECCDYFEVGQHGRVLDVAGAACQNPLMGRGGDVKEACPGCGVHLLTVDGPTHRYMTASPACWEAFGRVLAAVYASAERMLFHQVVVDAYAAQHPGEGQREQVQSVGMHLMTLCLFLEHGVDPSLGSGLHRRMIRRPAFHPIRPAGISPVTVLHVPLEGPGGKAREAVYEWGRAVWELYAHEHRTVRGWLQDAGFGVTISRGPTAAGQG